jgi:hypothetical protein
MRGRSSRRTDEERLRLFCEVVAKAQSRRAAADRTIKAGLTLRFGQFEGTAVETRLGDKDDVHALLIDLRKFLAKGGDICFFDIARIVRGVVTDPEMKDANEHNRSNWKIVLSEGLVKMEGWKHRTPEAWFDLIVNGEIFHDDATKLAEFQSLPDDVQAIARVSVNAMLLRMLPILRAERLLIETAFERRAFNF